MLADRTALVTGASRGIGAAIARVLAHAGARVALVARSTDALRVLAGEIGNDSIAIPCDLSDPEAMAGMANSVRAAFGGTPDILVNNAGVFELAPLHEMAEATFINALRTNLVAPFMLVHHFVPAMRERGTGHVVTIGSIADRSVMPGNGAYSPAKYGLRAMHEVLRMELRGTGVRATLISPGPVDTPLWDDVLREEEANSQVRSLPGRDVMLSPDAVAAAVAYVVSQPGTVNVDELRLSHS